MYKLVFVRHGQSVWNQENRFTGWTDVDLSERGVQEAQNAGKRLVDAGFHFKIAYTSYLKRAIKTLNFILEEMDLMWIPVEKSWRLNEKHYGFLQGMNKVEMVDKYGKEQVQIWRRSYDIAPPAIPEDSVLHPMRELRYQLAHDPAAIPGTESLKDTSNRIIPLWENSIKESLKTEKQVLIVAHGNSIRGILKYLKNISDEDIVGINIPTGVPNVMELDDNFNVIKDYYLASEEELLKLQAEVANQTKK